GGIATLNSYALGKSLQIRHATLLLGPDIIYQSQCNKHFLREIESH
ncbi:MAG: hypothetical protein ACI8VW_002855, partial [bacterium]